MENRNALLGLAAATVIAGLALPRILPKVRLAVRRAVALPYRSPGGGGEAPNADPARGIPA